MGNGIDNLKKGVPVKSRITMISALLIVGVLAYIGINKMTANKQADNVVGTGSERVVIPKGAQVKSSVVSAAAKPVRGDASVLPETSEVVKAVKEHENKKLDKAIEQGDTYIKGLEALNVSLQNLEKSVQDDGKDEKVALERAEAEKYAREHQMEAYKAQQNMLKMQQRIAYNEQATALRGQRVANQQKAVERIREMMNQVKLPNHDIEGLDGAVVALIKSETSERPFQITRNQLNKDKPAVENEVDAGAVDTVSDAAIVSDIESSDSCQGDSCVNIVAGDIAYGVMLTSVNSDEPGPVLVRVVSGPLSGAKLLGAQQLAGEKIVLEFSVMTYKGKEYSVEAFAVDPKTNRTALADDVDHHYLERYGRLLGSSFLEGYAETLQNSTTTTSTDGSTVTETEAIDDQQDRIIAAFGKVGEKLGPEVEKGFDIPVTVQVFSGTGIGVMFVSGVSVVSN